MNVSRMMIRLTLLTLVIATAPLARAEETWVFTTFAGVSPGAADGVGAASSFYYPWGAAVDAQGNIYVADLGNGTIRKITPAGVVSTYAGVPGERGTANGPLASARFHQPHDLAFDPSGNLYVADAHQGVVRKIAPDGTVTDFAGAPGQFGSVDGTGPAARFRHPGAIACDAAGNVYVADEDDHTIRKITAAGVVTTLAGRSGVAGPTNGPGPDARFFRPTGIAVDAIGNVFVAEPQNFTIRKITPGGSVSTHAGSTGKRGSSNGTGSAARFWFPAALDVDAQGYLVVADYHSIRRIAPGGAVTRIAGEPEVEGSADGTGSAARFLGVHGIAFDLQGNAIASDGYNNTVRRVTMAGVVTTIAGRPSAGPDDGGPGVARLNYPQDVEVDASGNVFVADSGNHAIRRIGPGGQVSTLAGLPGSPGTADGTGSAARFNRPGYVALGSSGEVFVSDRGNYTIRKIAPDGAVTLFAGQPQVYGSADGTGSAAQFGAPGGMAVDASGNLILTDASNHTVRSITPQGTVSTLAGLARASGSNDGAGGAARFNAPDGLVIAPDGNIFVSDALNHTIRRVTPAGAVTTVAGQAGVKGTTDGQGSAASFDFPAGIAADAEGNLVVGDFNASTLRGVTAAGSVSTLAGSPYEYGWRNGAGSDARFDNPTGVAFDTKGTMYVADIYTHTIRRGVRCETGALCTLDGRFQLTLTARDPRSGTTGPGVPLQQNDLFGYFAIPALTGNARNPEVFVKMLDGQGVNGKFWVFFGGLTDFEYTLTVKDTTIGTSTSYTKQGGTSNGGFDVGSGVAAESCAGELDGAQLAPVTPEACSVGDDRLCLNAGRFRINLAARDPRTSNSGAGLSIPQDDLFGYFALPALTGSASNPEVFVKVLDGRPINGHFWIFYSGLTDLEYTMTVTDTVTGERKSYTKAGGSACGAFDVDAF